MNAKVYEKEFLQSCCFSRLSEGKENSLKSPPPSRQMSGNFVYHHRDLLSLADISYLVSRSRKFSRSGHMVSMEQENSILFLNSRISLHSSLFFLILSFLLF